MSAACAAVALGDLLVDRGLVGLGLDGEDDLVHLHHVAVGELARPEESLDPGAQLHLVHRGRPADEFELVGDRCLLGGLHEDSRRRGLLCEAAGGESCDHTGRDERCDR